MIKWGILSTFNLTELNLARRKTCLLDMSMYHMQLTLTIQSEKEGDRFACHHLWLRHNNEQNTLWLRVSHISLSENIFIGCVSNHRLTLTIAFFVRHINIQVSASPSSARQHYCSEYNANLHKNMFPPVEWQQHVSGWRLRKGWIFQWELFFETSKCAYGFN